MSARIPFPLRIACALAPLVVACGDAGVSEEDAAELARYAAFFDVRDQDGDVAASARFELPGDDCSVELEGGSVSVNGTPLAGAFGAAPCGPFAYGAAVPRATDGHYEVAVAFRSSRVELTVDATPVHIEAPRAEQAVSASAPVTVTWDRAVADAEVVVFNADAQCVYSGYAEVTDRSAVFPYLELAGTPPCDAHVALRYREIQPVPEPFRAGELAHGVEQIVAVRVTN
jgi:hypothetical protein